MRLRDEPLRPVKPRNKLTILNKGGISRAFRIEKDSVDETIELDPIHYVKSSGDSPGIDLVISAVTSNDITGFKMNVSGSAGKRRQ